jgi:hypothetical protein
VGLNKSNTKVRRVLAAMQGWETTQTWNPVLMPIDEAGGERMENAWQKMQKPTIALHGLVR